MCERVVRAESNRQHLTVIALERVEACRRRPISARAAQLDHALLAVAAAATQPDRVVFGDKGSVAATTSNRLDLAVELYFLWNGHAVLVAVAELAIAAGTPGVRVAIRVDVGGVVFAAGEVLDLFQERLNASWERKLDTVQTRDSELPVAIVSHRIQPPLVIHKDGVVGAAENLFNLDRQVKLLRLVVILHVIEA